MAPKSGGPMPARFLVSHAGKTTISHYLKNSQMIDFQELFIWLAREHYLSRLLGVLASLGSSLGAHGSSWRLLVEIHENHFLILKNAYIPFFSAVLNVSHEV